MAQNPLAPPPPTGGPLDGWLYLLWRRLTQAGQVAWATIDFSGSSFADILGTLGVSKGGTGLTALGSANQVLAVNSGGTALEYQTPSGSGGALSNAISTPTTIAADTSYIVLSYLTVTSDLTVNGNLGVL